ncbi:putative RNA recognition motif protein [Trichinella spiralis]|uniref:putative RNA recognition motif protein n=1 Tax=Trichinella spiralis TaxID=6334 RepID=UPI0001EFBBA5|nr:putative RNA recognition motif protein [Trichinella spiralis]
MKPFNAISTFGSTLKNNVVNSAKIALRKLVANDGYMASMHDQYGAQNPPSRVLLVRNLMDNVVEADLVDALSPFGLVSYVSLTSRGSALVEFESITAAERCVTFNAVSDQLETEAPSNVLIIYVQNAKYPITTEVIHQICKPIGFVNRIIINRRDGIQALVEFRDIETARVAKQRLNGCDIYSGCCTVKIEFAKVQFLDSYKQTTRTCKAYTPNVPVTNAQKVFPQSTILHTTCRTKITCLLLTDRTNYAQQSTYTKLFHRQNNDGSTLSQIKLTIHIKVQQGFTPIISVRSWNQKEITSLITTFITTRSKTGFHFCTVRVICSTMCTHRGFSIDSDLWNRFSKLHHLTVKKNEPDQVDYTGEMEAMPPPAAYGRPMFDMENASPFKADQLASAAAFNRPPYDPEAMLVLKGVTKKLLPGAGAYSRSPYDSDPTMRPNPFGDRQPDFRDAPYPKQAYYPNRRGGDGYCLPEDMSPRPGRGYYDDFRGPPDPKMGSYPGYGDVDGAYRGTYDDRMKDDFGMHQESTVIMIYGLDPTSVNCDKLFNLLCLYGNVIRIKFLKSKNDTVMVQMGEPIAAGRVIENLHNALVFGKRIHVAMSRQRQLNEVRDPTEMPDGSSSYKDFTGSRFQRFTSPDIAAKNRITNPQKYLYFFNAPPNVTEERLISLFKDSNAPEPTNVKIFNKKELVKNSAGIIEFENEAAATEALMLCNHTNIESYGSKSPFVLKMCFAGPAHTSVSVVGGGGSYRGRGEIGRFNGPASPPNPRPRGPSSRYGGPPPRGYARENSRGSWGYGNRGARGVYKASAHRSKWRKKGSLDQNLNI